MFFTDADFGVVCDEDELDILTRSDPATLERAVSIAMEEVAGYIRPKYDIEKAFAAQGDARNRMLVQVVASVALWYLGQSLPGGMALDRRQTLYEQAVAWLDKVSRLNSPIAPGLPEYASEDGATAPAGPVRFGGMAPNKYDY